MQAAKEAKVADDDDGARDFLKKSGFNLKTSKAIIETVVQQEQRHARSVWDFVQGITSVARDQGHQDARLQMERVAGKMLDKVTAN